MAEIDGLTEVIKKLSELALNTRRVERPLEAIGVYMLGSVEKNFQQQGRPKKWSPLSPRTLAGRRKGRGKGGPKILIDRARLKNSMNHKVHIGEPSSYVEIGTNVIYAPRHHFGYDGADKSGPGQQKTPAREFLMIQEEDNKNIENIFKRHVGII